MEARRSVRSVYTNMARHTDGLSESNNNGSKEKQTKPGCIFKVSLWTECDMEIKRGVKIDSKISGKMAQWSHHQLRRGRLGKAIWRGRQTSGIQF